MLLQYSDRGYPEDQNLFAGFAISGAFSISGLVQFVEPAVKLLDVRLLDLGYARRKRHADLVNLIPLSHIKIPHDAHVTVLDAGEAEVCDSLADKRRKISIEPRQIRRNEEVIRLAVFIDHV